MLAERLSAAPRRVLLEHAAAIVALSGAVSTIASGRGATRGEILLAIATMLPLFLASRPWRLPWQLQAIMASLPLGALVVALAHGDAFGADRIGKYAYFAALLLALVAWAGTRARRFALALSIVGLGTLSLTYSLVFWVAAGNPNALLAGIIEWHNQNAAFLLPAYAVAVFLGTFGLGGALAGVRRRLRGLAQLATAAVAAFLGAGILLTGSRFGSILATLVTLTAVAAVVVVALGRRSWRPALALAGILAGIAVVAIVLRSPLLFPESGDAVNASPLAIVTGRGSGAGSMGARFDFWQAALGMGAAHPLFGVGLLRYADYANCYADRTIQIWSPHDEWLASWAEGGLALLLPLLALTVGVGWVVVRSLRPFPTFAAVLADPARWGAVAGLAASLGDLVLEYNLFYPSILTMVAGVAALAVEPLLPGRGGAAGDRSDAADAAQAVPAAGAAEAVPAADATVPAGAVGAGASAATASTVGGVPAADVARLRGGIVAFGVVCALVVVGVGGVLADPNGSRWPWRSDYPTTCLTSPWER